MEPVSYKPSKTALFFRRITLLAYLLGCPNLCIDKFKLSKRFIKFYSCFNIVNNILTFVLFFSTLGAFYLQDNLTETQRFSILFFSITIATFSSFYFIIYYHVRTAKQVILTLTVTLKAFYNDPEVERQMIKKSVTYLLVLVLNSFLSIIMINAGAYMDTVWRNLPFTTLATIYPDVNDDSNLANLTRVIVNFIFWWFLSRTFGIYALLTPLLCGLSHQYINLQSYFFNLSEIFERIDLTQKEKEDHYERQFKLGIKLHLETLRCTNKTQTICSGAFSGQLMFVTSTLVVLMAQMVFSTRNTGSLLGALSIAFGVLLTCGFIMWNAGDITIEASKLSTAIYFSGWYNCQHQSSVRIGKMVAIAMANAQKPVILQGFGYIGLSYEVYLKIVKLSYSIFSVFY